VPGDHLVELAEAHTGLDDRDLIVDVDLEDAAHLPKCDQHAALAGDAAAGEARPGAACGHRQTELAGYRDDLRHLGRGMRQDDHVRSAPVGHERLVMPVVLADLGAGQDPRRSQQRREPVDSTDHLTAL
jgi:hypothetical protein